MFSFIKKLGQHQSQQGPKLIAEKQFIQAKLVKQPLGTSTTNTATTTPSTTTSAKFMSSYDQLMNTTLNTDTEDDDANSRRLLTNKVNNSSVSGSFFAHNNVAKSRKPITGAGYFSSAMISSPLQPNYQTQFISSANLNTNQNAGNSYTKNDLNSSNNNTNISTFTSGL
jgi:hypothetical protein